MMANNVTNWAKILGTLGCGHDSMSHSRNMSLRKIFVHNGVANVCNGLVLIRRAIDVPNGYYMIDPHGGLVSAGTAIQYPYPEIEDMVPDFENMKRLTVSRDDVKNMIMFCNSVAEDQMRGINARLIVIDSTEMKHAHDSKISFPLPGSPVEGEVGVQAHAFRFALTEMLLYETVYLAYDNSARSQAAGGPKGPMFIGLDWGHCALISATYPRM